MFNTDIFKLEQALYKSEGIDYASIAFTDNQPILDLLEKKPAGVFPALDETLRLPKGSDSAFLDALAGHAKGNTLFSRNLRNPTKFLVKHFAGDVEYDVTGFLDKNRDALAEDVLNLLRDSGLPQVKSIAEKTVVSSTKALKKSLGFKFTQQLSELQTTLSKTEIHYIRCIKPNREKKPQTFEGSYSLTQMRNSGILEAVKIRKSGFPFRLKHEDFVKRYKAVVATVKFDDFKSGAEQLIKTMGIDLDQVQLGKTL